MYRSEEKKREKKLSDVNDGNNFGGNNFTDFDNGFAGQEIENQKGGNRNNNQYDNNQYSNNDNKMIMIIKLVLLIMRILKIIMMLIMILIHTKTTILILMNIIKI